MLKRRIQDLTVCFTYNFSCLHPQNRGQKDFRNQYQLCEEIQRGGFGIVYKAYRISDRLPVAVKYVEHKHVREWTMQDNQLIPTEICHLQMCANIPGVINLIDWFASSRGFMIIMERPEKCMDLFDVITVYGRLDEEVSRWIFVQIVDAVLEMRSAYSLVHRDIKDENVILDMESGAVKLVDFGAADFIDSAYKKHFQGTRSYAPPEWFKAKQNLPLESTCWSLGVLLYTMIAGRVPFKNEIQTCMARLHFPADVSQECQNLIQKCLCITPKRRISLNEIRSHPWSQNTSLSYAGSFSSLLRKRSLRSNNGMRRRAHRRRQNSVAWSSFSGNESDGEPALRRSFALAATPSPKPNGNLAGNQLNVSIYDFIPSTSTTTPVKEREEYFVPDVQTNSNHSEVPLHRPQPIQMLPEIQRSVKRNPLLRQLAEQKSSSSENNSFDMFHSINSTFSRYESIRDRTVELSDDAISTGQASSSLMYYSACESLPDSENEEPVFAPSKSPVFYYDDSLRSLAFLEDEDDALDTTYHDRTRTPSVQTNTEICKTPSPQLSVKNPQNLTPTEQKKAHKSVASSLNDTILSGVRRAKSLKLPFRDKSAVNKKYSVLASESPVKVVHQLVANSYDTLVTLSAKMADNTEQTPAIEPFYKDTRMAKISKNLGDIVAERKKMLLQNSQPKSSRSKSRDSASVKSLHYETVRFPLAVFDVCQQQLPILEGAPQSVQ